MEYGAIRKEGYTIKGGCKQGGSLITGALAVALVHAILPTHWLPFVLIGTSEKWRRKKILGVLTFQKCLTRGKAVILNVI